jgi:hypothetical protein
MHNAGQLKLLKHAYEVSPVEGYDDDDVEKPVIYGHGGANEGAGRGDAADLYQNGLTVGRPATI